jgi:hypothetical protein
MRVPPPRPGDPWLPLLSMAVGLLGLWLVVTETALWPGVALCLASGGWSTVSLVHRIRAARELR